MRPIHEIRLPAEAGGAGILGSDKHKYPADRSDAIALAEPWAALHNSEIWLASRPAELPAQQEQ